MPNESEKKNWLEIVAEGGLPQLLIGPAGKAISRLVGAGVEIPAAKLEQFAQAIRDETEAKSATMRILAEKSAELGLQDTGLLNRGLSSLIGKAYREQENREQVAKKAIELIADDPPDAESEGPSDDWLNVFEDHAARASSEDLRQFFARILAGEIRKPGQFSLSTMQMVSIMDAHLASIVETVAPFVWDDVLIPQRSLQGRVQFGLLLQLEEIGLLSTGSGMLTKPYTADENGMIAFTSKGVAVVCQFSPHQEVRIRTHAVSRSGSELLQILDFDPNVEAFLDAIWEIAPQYVTCGKIGHDENGQFIEDPVEMTRPNPTN